MAHAIVIWRFVGKDFNMVYWTSPGRFDHIGEDEGDTATPHCTVIYDRICCTSNTIHRHEHVVDPLENRRGKRRRRER